MQAIATPQLRWTGHPHRRPDSSWPPQPCRPNKSSATRSPATTIAIYNLAGQIRVEAGSGGEVGAELTRGGADAAKLKVLQSEVDGREALRVVYPSTGSATAHSSSGSSTQLRVHGRRHLRGCRRRRQGWRPPREAGHHRRGRRDRRPCRSPDHDPGRQAGGDLPGGGQSRGEPRGRGAVDRRLRRAGHRIRHPGRAQHRRRLRRGAGE